jgi:hypothetical protein
MSSVVEGLPYIPTTVPIEELPDLEVAATTPESELLPHIDVFSSDAPGAFGEQTKYAAQKLHTDVYLEHGFIKESDVNDLGFYVDEYVDRSTYWYVKNGSKVAAARQIDCDKKEGILSLPTIHNFAIDPDELAETAGVRSVVDLKPKEVVEISALASRKTEDGVRGDFDAVPALYTTLLRRSLEQGHKLWVLNVDPHFIRKLNGLLGEDQVHILGQSMQYMGPATTPVAINPQEVVRKILGTKDEAYDFHKAYLRGILTGVKDRNIPKDIRGLLAENEIPTSRTSALGRLVTNKEVAVQAGMMAYSAARAFPAAGLSEFHGNVWDLWSIDIATSIPYVRGLFSMYTSNSIPRRVGGAAMAVSSFVAPYAYLYAEGNSYPAYVNGIVGGLVTTAVGKEIFSRHRRAHKEAVLDAGLRQPLEDESAQLHLAD